jgi:hypothetical protein
VPICDTNHKSNVCIEALDSNGTVSASSRMSSNNEGSGKTNMISSFVTVIEGTKDLSLSEEKQRSPQHLRQPLGGTASSLVNTVGTVPVPTKCSNQLRRLLHSHSITKPPPAAVVAVPVNGDVADDAAAKRPIYPNLPYSPSSSPSSSPRLRRKPLRETTRVNSTVDGEYVQLNQYKLEQAIGQVITLFCSSTDFFVS